MPPYRIQKDQATNATEAPGASDLARRSASACQRPVLPLDAIFRPRSVAVVGASNRPGTLGREILKNLVAGGFTGTVFPVNARNPVVLSMKAYPRVSDIPDQVDLVVLAVPKKGVCAALYDAKKAGAKGAVIISAGFREVGGNGEELECDLVRTLKQTGIRTVGPNCMGVISTAPDILLNASFSEVCPRPGSVAFLSQSGALGQALLGMMEELGLGLSLFVSLGNQTDVNAADVMEYLLHDEQTRVVLLYQESFGDPRKFPHAAKRLSEKVPIVAVKAGRTAAGARAAFSHTGSLAGTEIAVDALFEDCGVLRVATVDALFDVARALSTQPLPKGPRVAIVTNAGGPGILAADACAAKGLTIPSLAPETEEALRPQLNAEASLRNPVDLIASAGPEEYEIALRGVLADPNVDAVLTIFVPPVVVDPEPVAQAIVRARDTARHKPLLSCFMSRGGRAPIGVKILQDAGIPAYKFPESATRALGAMATYAAWRARPKEPHVRPAGIDIERAARVLDQIRGDGHATLHAGFDLVSAYGIPVVATRVVHSLEEALAAAQDVRFPVVIKVDARSTVHKTDIGGVFCDLRDEAELVRAFLRLPKGSPVVVQHMVIGARETILGMTLDPSFGPLIMFGLGGVMVEAHGDVAFKVAPVTARDADELFARIRGHKILRGIRGAPPVDFDALRDALLRVSALVSDTPDIAEIEINPFLACPKGGESCAVDVRLRLASSHASTVTEPTLKSSKNPEPHTDSKTALD
jgi:acetate---CoA ligase (ADP-forming)